MRRLLLVAALIAPLPLAAQEPAHWVATWAPSYLATPLPAPGTADPVPTWSDRTVRQVAHLSLGGRRLRVRLTNEYGERPLVIGAAHVALRDTGASIRTATDRTLTFSGRPTVTLRPGAVVVSDPVDLTVPSLGDVAVSLWVRDTIRASTRHPAAHQTNYVSPHGDFSATASWAPDTTVTQWEWLAGIDVVAPATTGTIVTFGNSITDGSASTLDVNARWPDVLARRLTESREPPKSVVNAGIGGNRVLSPINGPSALARFDRDVLMQPGVTHVILLEGINDLNRGTLTTDPRDSVTADDIIFGYQQLIARAHERGILIYGATMTAIGGMDRPFTPGADQKRQAINAWIRAPGHFDGMIDFDAVTRDPAHPDRFLPAYDSGDHLHPNDAGYRAMGESIDLALFRRKGPR